MSYPYKTTPRLRAAILRRIERFGSGRIEVQSEILETLVREVNALSRLDTSPSDT